MLRSSWPKKRCPCPAGTALTLVMSVMGLGLGACFGLSGHGWLPSLAWRAGLSAVLIGLAVWDRRAGLLPNRGTLPLTGLGLASLAAHWLQRTMSPSALAVVGGGWAVCLFVWWLRVLRGGDVKLIMSLLALFPEVRFVWILLAILLVGSLSAIVVKEGRTGLRRLGALFYTVFVGRTLPTRDEIEASYRQPGGSHRLGYLFSLAGLVCLWLPWA